MKGYLAIFAVTSVVVYIVANSVSHTTSSTSTASASSTPAAAAHITMLHGPSSDNSCHEDDGGARIYVTITLRNSGGAAGTVNPWATFDYSDGGNSTETYLTNYGHELSVPAHTEVDASFYHTFNPQQHSMIRCAGYTDLNSDDGGYYLPDREG